MGPPFFDQRVKSNPGQVRGSFPDTKTSEEEEGQESLRLGDIIILPQQKKGCSVSSDSWSKECVQEEESLFVEQDLGYRERTARLDALDPSSNWLEGTCRRVLPFQDSNPIFARVVLSDFMVRNCWGSQTRDFYHQKKKRWKSKVRSPVTGSGHSSPWSTVQLPTVYGRLHLYTSYGHRTCQCFSGTVI